MMAKHSNPMSAAERAAEERASVPDTKFYTGVWLVCRRGGRRLPSVRYQSFEEAKAAAERLAIENPGKTFDTYQERARTKLKAPRACEVAA